MVDRAPVVWIIAEEQWTRALLRAELIERGFDAVGFLTMHDAMEQLASRPPDAIVFELRAQPVSHVERLLKIGVPVVVTGGHPEIDDPALRALPIAAVLPRPVTLGAIAERIAALGGRP